jgi:hypothetical protein
MQLTRDPQMPALIDEEMMRFGALIADPAIRDRMQRFVETGERLDLLP